MSERAGWTEPQPCDLCGLPIEGAPWVIDTPMKRYAFCCDGCLGIFQMLHDIDAGTAPGAGPAKR